MKPSLLLAALVLSFAVSEHAGAQLLFSNYGAAVEIAEGDVLVSEPNSRYRAGTIYVYRQADGEWAESARIIAPDAANYDGFGHDLAPSGNRMLVAATRQGSGRIYEFQRHADGAWTLKNTISEGGLSTEDGFASTVAFDGDLAVVGAPGKVQFGPPGHPKKTGSVYVYRLNPAGEWAREAILTAGNAENASAFGHAVAIVDGHIVVGAPGTNKQTGSAYVFSSESGAWKEASILTYTGAGEGSEFGASVERAGSLVLVGAPGADPAGAVVAFAQSEGGWSEDRTLNPFDGQKRGGFGAYLSAGQDAMVISAPMAMRAQGSVYVIEGKSGAWTGAARVTAVEARGGDFFGGAVAMGDDLLVVSSLGDDGMAGTAAVFERTGAGWNQTATLRSEPANLEPITGEKKDCADGSADLFECSRVDLISFLPVQALGGARGVMVNDLWGWTDPTTEREYVLQGRTDGTSFIDITDPSNPVYLGQLPLTEGAQPAVWRDI
ncbi:MAG: hypothetical protein WD275_00295, partial [Rhodothermales bacterium]